MSDLSSFFGSQERSKGAELVRKDQVVISSASDTNVSAFIKGSSACRVAFVADEVAAPSFTSNCSCPQARAGELCKHIWAVLLKLKEKSADFLEGKEAVVAPSVQKSAAETARQAKADEFKAQQKQKIKDRNKAIRQQKKIGDRGPQFSYPDPVQESLDYFSANGFALEEFDMPSLLSARKLLSRVFHPDKGGTHDEAVELASHFECLEEYLKD